jgi:hypothetical protein
MFRLRKGSLATLYREGVEEGLVIVAENLPDEPSTCSRRARVVQGHKDRVVDLVYYTLIPVDEADICET